MLDLAKKTYEALNSQLLEELPILYEHSCEILSICLKAFIVGHLRLMQHMRTNIQQILAQVKILRFFFFLINKNDLNRQHHQVVPHN